MIFCSKYICNMFSIEVARCGVRKRQCTAAAATASESHFSIVTSSASQGSAVPDTPSETLTEALVGNIAYLFSCIIVAVPLPPSTQA